MRYTVDVTRIGIRLALSLATIVAVSISVAAQAEDQAKTFRYDFRAGDRYRIVGINAQTYTVDGVVAGAFEELIRIQTEVGEVGAAGATIRAVYQIATEESDSVGGLFSASREYDVSFSQTESGRIVAPPGSFVPQVRDVPLFPDRPIAPGESWTASATEVHDFRASFGIESPVVVPMTVAYRYVGPAERNGAALDLIDIQYTTFYRPGPSDPTAEFVRLMTGRYEQLLYWDSARGRPQFYEERFTQFVQTRDGGRFEFVGRASGEVVDSVQLDRAAMQRDIEAALEAEAIEGAQVRQSDAGVIIAIEDVRFAPDSAELLPGELEKLAFIGSILQRYADRDVLITGHTALAGTEAGRRQLSEERARAVGRFFVENGVRSRDRLVYRGMGAREPVADNTTEEGRRKNRRVEITILEN